MKQLTRIICTACIALGMAWLPQRAAALADALGVLEGLDVSERADTSFVQISFSAPVHYVRHFPVGAGDVIQITVSATAVRQIGEEQLQLRKTLNWTPTRDMPLLDVTYEGDVSNGPNLVVRFRTPVKFTVTEGADSRSVIVAVKKPPALPVAPPAPGEPEEPLPVLPMLEPVTDSKAGEWMTQGREAMTANNYSQATQIFTKVLQHPGHKYLPEAKELLGLARERNKQLAHAKAEYEEYLRLYPQGEGADRVRQRLNALLTLSEPEKEKLRAAKGGVGAEEKAGGMTYNGSLAQYYRRDSSTTDDLGDIVNQSALTSYFDLSGRRSGQRYDVRTQFTGSYMHDFLTDGTGSEARVSALYVDTSTHAHDLSAKLGRQSRSSGGVLGRFDGGLFTYGFAPKWKINAVAGAPVDLSAESVVQTGHYLYGMSVDGGTFADYWDVSLFAINQTADGITDRTAVGSELRFATPSTSVFALADYDVSYGVLNTLLAQGNWQAESGAALNLVLDYRMSPTLTTTNALQGQTTVSNLSDLIDLMGSEDAVRQLARDRTARSRTATLGGNLPLNENLQLTGDVTLSNLGSMPASGGVDAVPGTGNEFIYSIQLVGSNLLKEGDVSIVGLRYYDAKDSNTSSLILNSRYPLTDDWRINPRLRVDYKTGATSGDTLTFKPQLRVDYRVKKDLTLELEGGVEWNDQRSGTATTDTTGYYYSIGYRWNF